MWVIDTKEEDVRRYRNKGLLMIKGVGKWRVSLILKVAQNAAASFSKYYFLLSTPFLPRNIMHCHLRFRSNVSLA